MHKNIKVLILLTSLTFVLLGFFVHFFPHSSLDIYISKELQEEVDEPRDIKLSSPITWVSILGNGIVGPVSVLLVAFLFFVTRHRREAKYVLFVFISDILVLLMKLGFRRPRPTEDLVNILQQFQQTSFPSGHVAHYTVFFGLLFFIILYKKIFPFALRVVVCLFLMLVMLMIPISRVYLGAHWATDVIGGYLVGVIFLSCMLWSYCKK